MNNPKYNDEFTIDEAYAFYEVWTSFPSEARPEFEKILENENPEGYKKFKEDLLLIEEEKENKIFHLLYQRSSLTHNFNIN